VVLAKFLRLLPISPLSTGLLPKILLPRLGSDVHGAHVIGTAVPASPRAGNGRRVRQVTKGPISAGRQWKELSGSNRGQLGRGAGRGNCLSRDAVPGVLRNFGEQSGTQEWFPQEGPQNNGWFWLGLRLQSGRADRKTSGPSGGAVR
jgi:hypothetical protein